MKKADISNELVRGAVEFHGHLGPFLVLGLRAGLLANALLGKDYFKTEALVVTEPLPPNSCFIDGVQFVTGCTMGKGNIKLKRGKDVSVLFSKEDKRLRLRLKKEIVNHIKDISSEETSEQISLKLLNKPDCELFDIER